MMSIVVTISASTLLPILAAIFIFIIVVMMVMVVALSFAWKIKQEEEKEVINSILEFCIILHNFEK